MEFVCTATTDETGVTTLNCAPTKINQKVNTDFKNGLRICIHDSMRVNAPALPTAKDPRFSARVIDPRKIPKFVDVLPVPGADWPVLEAGSEILRVVPQTVQILPSSLALTTDVWSYRGNTDYSSTFLGPTLLAESGDVSVVQYDYTGITETTHLLKNGANTLSVVDKHVHGTEEAEPEVRFIAHLHGSKNIAQDSDGYAEAWVTPDGRKSVV